MAINIPYGYIIKSRKGNSYIKTPAGWMTDGKLANQGIIQNLEAAAERKIEQYNKDDKNLVKIGQEYKSNNGKVYFYNGTNFMSADGKKKLAGGAQESAMRKLQQAASQASDEMSATTSDAEGDAGNQQSSDSVQDTASGETGNVQDTDSVQEPTSGEELPNSEQEQSPPSSSKLQGLADVISQHPKKRKLLALLSRGDKISLMAADIILADKADEAVKAITAAQ